MEFSLSWVDVERLKFYEEEFREEILSVNPSAQIEMPTAPGWLAGLKGKIPDYVYENGRNLLEFRHDDFSLFVDLIAHQDNRIIDTDSLSALDKIYRYTTGIQVRGNLGERIGFYIDARNTKEWGSRKYPESRDITAPGLGWVSNFGSYRFHDETIAYLIFKTSPFEIEIGKNLNRWGPGYRGALLLSDNATSYDLMKLKTQFWRIKFAHVFGYLEQYPRIVEQVFDEKSGCKKRYARKYIAAHRLEVNLFDGVNIGVHEAVVYGQRGIELAYLNPLMFLRSAEHYLGDQDNALMGADISLKLINGWKWYGEFLMDDIFIKKLGTDWYGNKFGYIGGVLWTDPFGFPDASLRIEYTRIKPFVYTHRFPINVYKHYDTALGHSLPPNSDEWYVAGSRCVTRRLFTGFELQYLRNGANTQERIVGGDIDQPNPAPEDVDLKFLEGEIRKKKSLRLVLSYEMLRNLFIKGECEFVSGTNFRIRNVPGRSFNANQFFISVGLNY
ncbi:hypothetical protein AMJ80_05140 [bacterium SM23_31]|nr:MAG: hypothetical protein AMJ80_05140 [bacterium SM23_31]